MGYNGIPVNEDVPKIGVFYMIADTFYCHSRTAEMVLAENALGNRVSHGTHFSFWHDQVKVVTDEWRRLPHHHFPRGRVSYDRSRKAYVIALDKCIPRERFLDIIEVFSLSGQPYEFRHGPNEGAHHYQCHNCNPDQAHRFA